MGGLIPKRFGTEGKFRKVETDMGQKLKSSSKQGRIGRDGRRSTQRDENQDGGKPGKTGDNVPTWYVVLDKRNQEPSRRNHRGE